MEFHSVILDTMKKRIKIVIVVISFFIPLSVLTTLYCVNSFLRYDEKLYYYGVNKLDRYEPINGRIIPVNGFVRFGSFGNPFNNSVELWDKDEFPILEKGCVYNHYANVVVDSSVSYGFNDNCLVAEIIAQNQQHYYVIFDDSNIATVVPMDICNGESPQKYFKLCSWFPDVNSAPQELLTKRHLFVLGSIIGGIVTLCLFVVLLALFLKNRRK